MQGGKLPSGRHLLARKHTPVDTSRAAGRAANRSGPSDIFGAAQPAAGGLSQSRPGTPSIFSAKQSSRPASRQVITLADVFPDDDTFGAADPSEYSSGPAAPVAPASLPSRTGPPAAGAQPRPHEPLLPSQRPNRSGDILADPPKQPAAGLGRPSSRPWANAPSQPGGIFG